MSKKEFLGNLEIELEKRKYENSEEILEYYYELIEDKKENGLKEKDIIKSLPEIDEIVKGLEIEEKIEIATKKPTVSNGIKALLATLSVLSLPILIPIIIVIGALILTLFVILFAIILTIVCILLSCIFGVVALIISLFTGGLPVGSILTALGVALIVIVLAVQGIKAIVSITRDITKYFVTKLKTKTEKRKDKKNEKNI